ncbi:histidine kinase [Halorubrum aidingense JCM 13560]|uniref:histidine kinase n=1 Tax=Halorubrum aidingense JCM 13560 TaxID=1230454 RepID=M0PC82_9EURY|nr:ATP-binding protein [Halorubrum aidingense]EMA67631.1 histidine kinase [Halorubrum aidingense JCM 13560]
MDPVFLAHVSIFAASALACVAAVPRARRIRHPETRDGMVALLLTVALWASGYVGYFLAPGETAKEASYIVGFVFALLSVGAWLYFCAAYTGRSPRRAPYRRAVVGVFVVVSLLKVTNPLHELYFTTAWATEPFPHLAIRHELLYWLVLGLSYAVIAVGFFMLLEQLYYTALDSRSLTALIAVTAIPTTATVAGESFSWLLPLMYEPPGVALFAVGTMFVYFRRFETIQFAADSDDPAIFLDQTGRIRDHNRAARLLFPALHGAIGEPLDAVLPRLAVDRDEDAVIAVAVDGERGGPRDGERDGDASTRYYQVSRNAFTSRGVTGGELLTVDDVTDRERYRLRLEERTAQLEALNRVVRHDIRNDMAVIHGWAETLRDHVDDEGQDALDRVLRKSTHVIELTETARDFVESLTGDAVPETKPVDLCGLLETEVQAARDSFPQAAFRLSPEPPAATVRGNEMLASVFRNLLNNAVQHNDTDHPEVTVTCEAFDDRVRLRFADNGPGIPDDAKATIFGKGKKGIDSPGSGIGLYLVRALTEQFGGDVWVTDNEPRGAAFVVELPRAAAESADRPETDDDAATEPGAADDAASESDEADDTATDPGEADAADD